VSIGPLLDWADFAKIDAEGHERELLLAATTKQMQRIDIMVEIGNPGNAKAVFEHLTSINVPMYAQKLGWRASWMSPTCRPPTAREASSSRQQIACRGRRADMRRSEMPPRSLTVASPALNEERNIAAAIRSVLEAAATVPELSVEIIAIDDSSTDRTAEIIEGLCRDHANLRLLRNPRNIGLGASLRRAIADGRGEKFLVVPGDNDMPRATVELLFRSAYLADVVMCYF
jgi:hypothetical protein